MLSGFINVGMGWKWTLWWCSIFNAMAFVYCFLFMEETNYDRKHQHSSTTTVAPESTNEKTTAVEGSTEKAPATPVASDSETGDVQWPRKTYIDKLGLKDKKRPNRFMDIIIAPFKGFTYPAVVYAGYVSQPTTDSGRASTDVLIQKFDVWRQQPCLDGCTERHHRYCLYYRVWVLHCWRCRWLCRRYRRYHHRVCSFLSYTS